MTVALFRKREEIRDSFTAQPPHDTASAKQSPWLAHSASHQQWLRQALSLLTNKEFEIIRMLKLEGCSVAEISERTGLSQSSIKVTAHRGYKRLRKLMGPNHDE